MTRRELQQRLHALDEIRNIMGAMKNLALLETRKLARFLGAQQQVVAGVEAAAADFLHFYPPPAPAEPAQETLLLIGSERGFCGGFNEVLLERAGNGGTPGSPRIIAVGRKLCLKLENDARVLALLDGPNVAEEVPNVLSRLVEEIGALQARSGPLSLTVLHHREAGHEPAGRRLLPPFTERRDGVPAHGHPPLLNLDPTTFFMELVDHYLLAALHEVFYTSLMAENRQRIQHMQGAVDRLEQQTAELKLKYNTLRQEEITEEIEVILLSAASVEAFPKR